MNEPQSMGEYLALPEREKMRLAKRKNANKVCDTCVSQEGRHYCLLHSRQMRDMNIATCPDWKQRPEFRTEAVAQRRHDCHLDAVETQLRAEGLPVDGNGERWAAEERAGRIR